MSDAWRTLTDYIDKRIADALRRWKVPAAQISGVLDAGHGGTGGSGGSAPTGPAGGDLYDTYPNPKVGKIRTLAVTTAPPFDGAVLRWNAATSTLVWATLSVTGIAEAIIDSDGEPLVDSDGEPIVEAP